MVRAGSGSACEGVRVNSSSDHPKQEPVVTSDLVPSARVSAEELGLLRAFLGAEIDAILFGGE
jgi:hypothetical protein